MNEIGFNMARKELDVAVFMITYNHGPYVEKAIQGILSQKTRYSFKLIIGDDHSSDATGKIVSAYKNSVPELIDVLTNTENIGMDANGLRTLRRAIETGARYIAFCEGDDFWTDVHKIEKQVSFLDSNPDISVCATQFSVYQQSEENVYQYPLIKQLPYTLTMVNGVHLFDLEDSFTLWLTKTVTAMVRTQSLSLELLEEINSFRDVHLFAVALRDAKGAILEDFTSVYRVHDGGVWSHLDNQRRLLDSFKAFTELEIYFKNSRALKHRLIRMLSKIIDDQIKDHQGLWKRYHVIILIFQLFRRSGSIRLVLGKFKSLLNKVLYG